MSLPKAVYSVNPRFFWRYTREPHVFSSLNSTMHYDKTFVTTLFLRGSGYVMVEGKTMYFTSGDILLVSPHEFHRCFVDTCPDHERISLYVSPSLADGFDAPASILFGAFLGRPLGEGNVIPASLVRDVGIDALFSELRLPEKDDPTADVLMQCRVVEILLRLREAVARNKEIPETLRKNNTVDNAIAYINAHLGEDLSTATLSDFLYVDKSYLCRVFKRFTGATVNEYVTQKRVDYARRLLSEGSSCTEACFKSGFGNYSSFYQYFRRYTGKVPKSGMGPTQNAENKRQNIAPGP